jgi:hypothetical protein
MEELSYWAKTLLTRNYFKFSSNRSAPFINVLMKLLLTTCWIPHHSA